MSPVGIERPNQPVALGLLGAITTYNIVQDKEDFSYLTSLDGLGL